jgi:mRNA-degrading endonuclease toxin of MazEF toxin-antitoxin module
MLVVRFGGHGPTNAGPSCSSVDRRRTGFADVSSQPEVTTTIRLNPATVALERGDGLPEACIANCDNLVTANQDDLIEYITTLRPERMSEIDRALRFALALDQ